MRNELRQSWPDRVCIAVEFAGRLGVASLFWASVALDIVPHWPSAISFIAQRGLPAPTTLAVLATLFEAGVPLLLFVPRLQRAGQVGLAAYCVLTALLFHAFWAEPAGFSRLNGMFHFFKNLALCGALLMAAAQSGPSKAGRP